MSTDLKTELVKAASIGPPETAPGPSLPAVIADAGEKASTRFEPGTIVRDR